MIALQGGCEIARLLLWRSPHRHGRQRRAKTDLENQSGDQKFRLFLGIDNLHRRATAQPAHFLGPRNGRIARRRLGRLPCFGSGEIGLTIQPITEFFIAPLTPGRMGFQPVTHLCAENCFVRGVVEVHHAAFSIRVVASRSRQ